MADRLGERAVGEEAAERAPHREGAAAGLLEEEREELAVAAVPGQRAERAGERLVEPVLLRARRDEQRAGEARR